MNAGEPKKDAEPKPPSGLWHRKSTIIAGFSVVAIVLHLVLRTSIKTLRLQIAAFDSLNEFTARAGDAVRLQGIER